MGYRVRLERRAEKELRSLDQRDRSRVLQAIEALANEPRPNGVKKLKGEATVVWRIRVGSFRILYTINDTVLTISVIRVGHRKEIYR